MITTARPLPISEMLNHHKSINDKTIWCGQNQEEILTHKSWISFTLIFEWFKKQNGRVPVVFLPKFYCFDTLYQLKEKANFVYYNINDNFLPNYRQCLELNKCQKADIFVFVHYFGQQLNANDAKIFCKNNGALLIEDAVHVLLGKGNTGKFGDFILYSPWKICGLPDGAILLINSKGACSLDANNVKNQIANIYTESKKYPDRLIFNWKVKKIIQKILPNRKSDFSKVGKYIPEKEIKYFISRFSRNFLLHLTAEDVLRLGDKKRINGLVLEDCLSNKYKITYVNKNDIPYASAFMLKANQRDIWNEVAEMGEIIFRWPELDPSIDMEDEVYTLKSNLLYIANHDGLTPDYIHSKLCKTRIQDRDESLEIHSITDQEYTELCDEAEYPIPLLQSCVYAKAKADVQGWETQYWVIYCNNEIIAFFLTQRKYKSVYRINRGPYILDEKHRTEIYDLIRRKFGSNGHILFFAPEYEQTGKSINLLLSLNFKYKNNYFSTGYIDLRNDEEELRKKIDSKWRNQLKMSEKLELSVYSGEDEDTFGRLLLLHTNDKACRSYRDSGDNITKHLYKKGNLKSLYIMGDHNDVISMIMIATHNKTATYYIGWSNSEGYRKNANRLLLWEAVKKLKADGYEWLDIGGIDTINTSNIAEFKLGTGCSYFNLVGEFVTY